MTIFIVILAALMLAPGAAQAEPISSAFAVAFAAGSAGGLIAGVSAFAQAIGATFVGKLIFGAALSLVGQLFAKKPKGVKPSGIQTEQTTVGDTTPQKLIVGRYAVEGHAIVPAYSYGPDNSVLTYVLEVSNIPVNGLTGRVIIDGQYTDLVPADDDATRLNFDTLGYQPTATTLGSFSTSARGWLWFYDGTQTAASSHMVEVYGSHPDRPWTVDHILKKSAYAVLEFPLNRNVYSGMPAVRFELDGISLYDPRKDTTVGGSGAHRWADPATWEFTRNPQVISYNVLRGITLPSGDIYGGEVPAEDLPLDNWFAAMNECDVVIGDRPQYVAGFEINTGTMEPFEVIEEMNRASFAQMSEFGGVFRVRVGAPAAPVMSLTDDDFMITEPSRYDPFPGLADTYNAVTGTYVEPADIWEGRSADAVLNAGWEAEDGGRRLTINIGLPAVSDKSQAQHLLNSYLKDQRRFRVHQMVLPPSFAEIEMLDTISWTSEINGYTAKTFEVMSVEDRPDTLNQMVTVREREAGDVAWEPADDLPAVAPHNPRTEPAQIVPTLTVTSSSVTDGSGTPRRPAIKIAWPGDEAPSAELIKYEIRLAGDTSGDIVTSGSVGSREGQTVTIDGLVRGVSYEVRTKYLTGMPSEWSAWSAVTVADIGVSMADLANEVILDLDQAQATADNVRADHDALVFGFTGTLADKFFAIDEDLTQITTDIEEVYDDATGQVKATALSGYYTKAEADSAASGQIDAFEAEILTSDGQVKSTLLTQYYTFSETDAAISSASETLSAKIASFDPMNGVFDFSDDPVNWSQDHSNFNGIIGNSDYTILTGDEYAGGRALEVVSSNRIYYGTKIPIVRSRQYRVTAKVRNMSASGPNTIYAGVITYDSAGVYETSGAGTHRYCAAQAVDMPNDGEWHIYEGVITGGGITRNEFRETTAYAGPMCILNYDQPGQITEVDYCRIEDITEVRAVESNLETNYLTSAETDQAIAGVSETLTTRIEDVESDTDDLNGEIVDIKGLELAGDTAFGALLTQLQVDAGGTSAVVSQQGSAITDLEGNASAMLAFRVKAGSAGGELELIAADDTDGDPESIARIDFDQIIATGTLYSSMMVVTDLSGNLVPDRPFTAGDFKGWSTNADFSIVERDPNSGSKAVRTIPSNYGVSIDPSSSAEFIISDPFPVVEGDILKWSYRVASGGGTRYRRASFGIRWFDKNGGFLSGAYDMPEVTVTSYELREGGVTVPEGAVSARVRLYSFGSPYTDGQLFFSSVSVHKLQDGATLITPNSVTTDLVAANAITAEKINVTNLRAITANLGSGTVSGRLESPDFTAGSDGLMLDFSTGDAEFNSLVTRSWVVDGAVSNKGSDSLAGPVNRISQIVVNAYLGPVQTDQFWQIAGYGEARRSQTAWLPGQQGGTDGYYEYDYGTTLRLQARYKTAGSWSGFEELAVQTANDDLIWDILKFSSSIQGDYENVQVRIVAYAEPRSTSQDFSTTQGPTTTYSNVRNFTLVARALVR